MDFRSTSRFDPLTWLRLKVVGAACVLGAAVAFLTFTMAGLIVLGVAFGVAAVVALVLWRTRPQLFTWDPTRDGASGSGEGAVSPGKIVSAAAAARERGERELATPSRR